MADPETRACRIFVVDDHPGVREGLTLLLEQRGICVCGDAGDGAETLRRLESARPDLVLVDLSLEGQSGVALIEQLHARGVVVVVYSMHEDATHVKESFSAGATGYVTKREGADALVRAIGEVFAGRRYLSEQSRDRLIDDSLGNDYPQSHHASLSEREAMVLDRTGDGDSSKDIAQRLHISPRTVETYYTRIMEKLGLTNMKELRRYAIRRGQHNGS